MLLITDIRLCTVIVSLIIHSVCGFDIDAREIRAKVRHQRHLSKNVYYNQHPESYAYSGNMQSINENSAMRSSESNWMLVGNHKPEFPDCDSYRPTVFEEQPTGINVFQVRAHDTDESQTITYSFVQPSDKFSIDPNTGKITTKKIFNRDDPDREKEVLLSVRATDDGRPALDVVCPLKFKILDINDNPPVFDRTSYEDESFSLDMKVGDVALEVKAFDVDDGDNGTVVYQLTANPNIRNSAEDVSYFKINNKTGYITLNKELKNKPVGYKFRFRVSASDMGQAPMSAYVEVGLTLLDSSKKPPVFTETPANPIRLLESYNDFKSSIATLRAESRDNEEKPIFTLLSFTPEQSNGKNTFRLENDGTQAHLVLAKALDYENIQEYSLIVQIRNKYKLTAKHTVIVKLEDVNDSPPVFGDILDGAIFENEPPGTFIMQIRATDADTKPDYKDITYELGDHQDKFAIDPRSGNVTSLVSFDREVKDSYTIKVIATDGAPAASSIHGEHNSVSHPFQIDIKDKNDNPPHFSKARYEKVDINEDADKNSLVAEVKANDEDSDSVITYTITGGDSNNDFQIVNETGRITVRNSLDYETVKNYELEVTASDGLYSDRCTVMINVVNINDNKPVFLPFKDNITFLEETPQEGCIVQVEAYDPDIPNRNDPQNIVYSIVKEDQKHFFAIDEKGCLTLTKPLDRDPPNGIPAWQVRISANDNNGSTSNLGRTLENSVEVVIHLVDINDNAPYLDMEPVIWTENQSPGGTITQLKAKDDDTEENGPPFKFELALDASEEIRRKFSVHGSNIIALEKFDREEQKEYKVPISITDGGNPPQTNTSILTVIIGDVNDNPMEAGSSEISVFYMETRRFDVEIGRVYVKDPDDWDLPDKTFRSDLSSQLLSSYFSANEKSGMITLSASAPPGNYTLTFEVTEAATKYFELHTVTASVTVTVKMIPEEAVDKSGSIRIEGITQEDFVTKNKDGQNRVDVLRSFLADTLNNTEENVDVFTVLHSPILRDHRFLDVRFSAHGSPYYAPERINSAITRHFRELESRLGGQISMVGVDECLQEKAFCEQSCRNELIKGNSSATVFTNETSFVGIMAYVSWKCECSVISKQTCLNGGTPQEESCLCPAGYDGPNCETTLISFPGDGWAIYPSFEACENPSLEMLITTHQDGMVFYVGPVTEQRTSSEVTDFMSLEIIDGHAVLLVDYGSGTSRVEHKSNSLTDNNIHKIDILLLRESVELVVDDCKQHTCQNVASMKGPNEFLNVNGPLQVGGSFVNLRRVGEKRNWSYLPLGIPFVGCVQNFTFNKKFYDLGKPSDSHNTEQSCTYNAPIVVSFDWTFLIAVLACVLVLAILLLAVVAHRRNVEEMYKDTDDIRENIINYEDEGGGEGDMTGYDMNVLRMYDPIDSKRMDGLLPIPGDEVPDICGFLDGKKYTVDNDPETMPFDDVRHYAYEGDGNTTGSLSSLASGTDEGDLNFDYLSNFGPRFRKLADMYGEDASDEDSDTYHNAASESWC